jgi:hypothetical protein
LSPPSHGSDLLITSSLIGSLVLWITSYAVVAIISCC